MDIQPLKLTLHRDEARALQTFFPYLRELVKMRIRDHENNIDLHLSFRAQFVLFDNVCRMFQKKLVTDSKRISLKLPFPESLAFYVLLKSMLINEREIYLLNIRQQVIGKLHHYLMDPGNTVEFLNGRGIYAAP